MSQRSRRARQQQLQRRARWRIAGIAAGALVVVGLVVALVSTLGSDDDAGGGSSSAASGSVRVSMTEFAFDPDPIVLRSGDDAELDVVNDGLVPHNLLIGELGKGTPNLASGEEAVVDLAGQPAGTYRVVCDIPGHIEAGMVTELVLE